MVKNKDEWLDSRNKLKERKKRGAKDGRTGGDEPAEFGFPMGGFKEQIERLLDAARRKNSGG